MQLIKEPIRFKVGVVLVLPPLVILSGSLGYYWIENGWSWRDALYMTVITVSTVGYGEVHQLSEGGRIFSILLITLSFGVFAYCATMVASFIAEGGIHQFIEKMRMEHEINRLTDHYIVCGLGRKGRAVCRHLHDYKMPFVVIERNAELIPITEDLGYSYLHGDSADDHILQNAGIERAKGLAAMLGDDPDNVFLVLSAQQLNPKLSIVAWTSEPSAEKKLYRAGADKVLTPFELGGFQVVQSLLRPEVVNFLEFALDIQNKKVQLEEIKIGKDSAVIGKTLQELDLNQDLKVLSIIRNGEHQFSVTGQTRFESGDILVVLGPGEHLYTIRQTCQ